MGDVPDLDGVVGGGIGEGWGGAEGTGPGLCVVCVVVDEDAVAVDEGNFWFFGLVGLRGVKGSRQGADES